jgi:alkylation response protein AidB-like acyl-CoA dehydrogenase
MTISEADLEEISSTLRAALAPHDGGSATPVLTGFGWADLLAADPGAAVPLVFEALGSSGASARALSDVMLHALGSPPGGPTAVVIPVADGEAQAAGRLDGGRLEVDGVCVEEPGPGPVVVAVAAEVGGDVRLAVVPSGTLTVREVEGADPWLGLRRVQGQTMSFDLLPVERSPSWRQAVAWGRVALAAQLVGVVDTSLRLATDHARTRVQFGRPVGTFQAVQHRLADVLIALEGARATVGAASEHGEGLAAMVAKSTAGVAARVAAANCLQVIAGMGFTWEHPLHRYQKRGLVLDRLLGSSDYLPGAIGDTLVRLGEAPRLVELI